MPTDYYKQEGINVDSIDPWKASGPGWSNAGVTIFFNGDHPPRTIYEKDLTGDAAVLFRHSVEIVAHLKRAIAKQLKWEKLSI